MKKRIPSSKMVNAVISPLWLLSIEGQNDLPADIEGRAGCECQMERLLEGSYLPSDWSLQYEAVLFGIL
jgi:hypothetical protein